MYSFKDQTKTFFNRSGAFLAGWDYMYQIALRGVNRDLSEEYTVQFVEVLRDGGLLAYAFLIKRPEEVELLLLNLPDETACSEVLSALIQWLGTPSLTVRLKYEYPEMHTWGFTPAEKEGRNYHYRYTLTV